MSKFLFVLCFSLLAVGLKAQSDSTSALVTDRPTASAAASLVGKGVFQIETGYAYQDFVFATVVNGDVRSQVLTLNNTLLRYGISNGVEINFSQSINRFRVKVDDTVLDGAESEFAPTAIGLRFKLAKEKGALPDLSLLANVIGSPFTGDETGTAIDVRVNANHTLGGGFSLGWNFGINYFDDIDEVTSIYTLVLGYSITPELAAFGEIFGTFTENFRQHSVDFGFTYLVNNNVQLDVFGGFGISDFAPDNLFGLGASFRLPGK